MTPIQLAKANASAIEDLLRDSRLSNCPILVINDVTLYLQAGTYERLWAVIQPAGTVLINAYYGHSFPDYRLSRQERRLTDRLIGDCHRVVPPCQLNNGIASGFGQLTPPLPDCDTVRRNFAPEGIFVNTKLPGRRHPAPLVSDQRFGNRVFFDFFQCRRTTVDRA